MLEVRDLEVYYGAIHAVKGISLRVEDGQIVTLIGSNRCLQVRRRSIRFRASYKPRSGNILF
jgi:ABC-type branched-chain amino acid transport systems, ATPase component